MTAVALWRMPAAVWGDEEDRRRRALWGCYAGFAAALWTKTQYVRVHLNDSPVTDLAVLVKHYTATIAILAILSYIVAVYGRYECDTDVPRHVRFARTVQRVAARAAVATLVLLSVLFFTVVDRSHPSDRFVADHAGEWGATLYYTVFYVYLGAASAVCAVQWWLAVRSATRRHLRIGLGMMAVAMVIGVAYTLSRTLFLWISVADRPGEDFALAFDKWTEAGQVVLFTLFAVGASIPAFATGARRLRLWRAQAALHPLWRDLMTAFPEQPFAPPAPLARELLRLGTPADVRVDRWAADIADAVEQLRHWAPEAPVPDGGPEESARWIASALAAHASGAPAGPPGPALVPPQAADQDGEIAWLLRVSAAYRDTARRSAPPRPAPVPTPKGTPS
ncbi:MAB_1171c family putative transporter [Streptomyces sp. SPB074]|uniref:MAB_1171c family putative transporter n=1 Tax=Streptomyces sp. (strain SPB074) TaxID=465543 RepID=UPI000681470B|nr:MAB_1171c family putative transporter [Streptomyces sp. SPB074]